ncbi:MAG: ZIP family metal transporter [Bacteroidetes bacterium]|nr:ZIP family metal transporter [Bacteroidota bacterium]MBU1423868.1 ZIP family metal transporter [Bacteroidota bacterium]MBU2471123.1 ZIP family metal transporter [Bacteroidota bacterium]MBU2635679.1 ZIP family metal transporter [Bacteroidota bacterium]
MLTIILFGLLAAGAELLGGYLITLRHEWPRKIQEYLIALGAGFILALVFLELIPESIDKIGPQAPLFFLFGFALIHFFEHTFIGHLHFGEETHTDIMISKTASYSAVLGLFIHAFFDGLAISAGFHFDFYIGLMLFFGITLHKIPEGITISSIMLASNQSKKAAFLATASCATATMLGVLSVFFLAEVDIKIVGYVFALSAGVAVYVGASDLIPEINRSENRITPMVVFVGMLLFYLSRLMIVSFMEGH